jgi:hypothetical protein
MGIVARRRFLGILISIAVLPAIGIRAMAGRIRRKRSARASGSASADVTAERASTGRTGGTSGARYPGPLKRLSHEEIRRPGRWGG